MDGKGLKLNFKKFSTTTNDISKEFEQFTLTRKHFVDQFYKSILHNGHESLSRTSEEDSFEYSYTLENEDTPPAHKKKRIEAHELPALQKQSDATRKSETNNQIEATSSFYKRLEKGDKFIKGKTTFSLYMK